ncbi:MAG: carboxypeptidase M32 [Paracoccaceae bacterium]
MINSAYDTLLDHLKTTAALQQIGGIIGWDQEVMMPDKGAPQRAEQNAALESVIHARNIDQRFPDWFDSIDTDTLDVAGKVNVAEAKKSYARSTKIPADLASELARVTSASQRVWADARENSDFATFAPTLEKVLDLRRQEAACLAGSGGDLYDALLNDYEPGAKSAPLAELLGSLRPGLTELRGAIADKGIDVPKVQGEFDGDVQMAVARRLATAFEYDWDAGRIDLAVHPFSSGNNNDSRITTRVDPKNVFNCYYSTIHEVGHSKYEQGMPAELAMQPAGQYASMGVHESQSRMLENQIGRSRAFCEWMFGVMRDEMGDFGLNDAEALYCVVNRVESGFIRTEADELHYNLHVLLRFELERALIRDELQVADLEAAWNDNFKRDFGVEVPDAARGVLQDVHWSVGLFGYFPTYSLGNIYAGELFAQMQTVMPNLDEDFAKGDTSNALAWLGDNIHQKAHLAAPEQIIADAVGHAPTQKPLMDYLERKFTDLYDL